MGPGIAAIAAAAAVAGAGPSELAGQRMVVGLPGTSAPAPLLKEIGRGHVAGVILFSRNVRTRAQVRALVRRLQVARPRGEPPLIVAIDQEGGLVKRLPGAPSRSAADLGRSADAGLARREGRATARNLRGVGVNVNLAPVLDVGRRGSSMRSLRRSYGAAPRRVVRIGGAFAAGLRAGGVAPTGKHFPGLGAARGDQDQVVNTIRLSRERLRRTDERPFRRLASRLPMVMVGSAIYPALHPGRPALFSRRIATRELRAVAGFRGVSISDDLEVPSMRAYGSAAQRARACARAGVDVLLFAQSYANGAAGRRAVARAIATGRLSRAASELSAARVKALRETLR
jgi:beta-N-acetylhexosaminidase